MTFFPMLPSENENSEIYRFITFLGIEVLFIKQCPLKFASSNI